MLSLFVWTVSAFPAHIASAPPTGAESGQSAITRLLREIARGGVNLNFWGSLVTIILSIVAALFGLAILGGFFNIGIGSAKFGWASNVNKGAQSARGNLGVAGITIGGFLFLGAIIGIVIGFASLF